LGAGCRRFKSYYPDVKLKLTNKSLIYVNFFKFVLAKH